MFIERLSIYYNKINDITFIMVTIKILINAIILFFVFMITI